MRHFVLLLTLLSLISCVDQERLGADKSIFTYNEPGGISSLDPAFSRNFENVWAVNQLFDGLVQMSDEMEVIPSIAKSWEISEDLKTYTFNLRSDVFFHDHQAFEGGKGRRVTAHDFVYSFFRILDPEAASPGRSTLNCLDRGPKGDYLGFKAVNDTVFEIYLNEPYIPFLSILTLKYFSVVPHEVVDLYKEDFRNNPIGTGPYQFKIWKEGVKLVLVKNENYFEKDERGNALPYLDGVAISFIKDRSMAYQDFVQGKFDMMSGLHTSYKDKLLDVDGELLGKHQGKFILQKGPFLKTDYLGILVNPKIKTVQNSPLANKAVRQAINYAIDREKMVKYLRNNVGRPATSGFVPYGMPSFDETKVVGYHYNMEKARTILKDAGFTDIKSMPEVTLKTTLGYVDICEYIQHELSELGINVVVDIVEEGVFRQQVAQFKVNFFRKSWVADYPDAENFLALFHSANFSPEGPNYTHFSNTEFDSMYELSQIIENKEERYQLYQKMDSIILEHAPIIPLFYDEVIRFVQNDVSGLQLNAMNILNLKKVRKEK
jgi:oligopeptide transport system substrate-binding protein